MGLVLKNEGYVYISELGVEYELLEGVSIGSDKQYTSDIIFIMLMDTNYNVDTNFVDYVFGASLWGKDDGRYMQDCEEIIGQSVKAYEKRNGMTERIVDEE